MTQTQTAPAQPHLSWVPLCPSAYAPYAVEDLNADLARICGTFRIEPRPGQGGQIQGALSRRHLARFDTAVVSLDAHAVIRDPKMIRRDPGNCLFLLVQDEGTSRIVQGDRITELRPGDLYLADSTLPSDFVYTSRQSRQISVHLPRDETVRRLGRLCTGGIGIHRDDPLYLALYGVVARGLSSTRSGDGPLGEALLNILGAYFHALDHQTPPGDRREDGAYAAALRHISQHATDPDLDIAAIAVACGLSRRTLQRLFGRNGDTVSSRILTTRLETAWTRLHSTGSGSEESVAAIAFDCGFNDLSYFYRTFRARYGLPPGDLRRRRSLTQ
ncbi:helix-turn-helix domain-containing protein [Novispirillum itersonii]|uniref:helix-turn-helix domain-containing protein n=1 Tax=Novispirillum itersonii TaxID=189 RepID=UPI00037D1397|nr:helix-turn-helix domain-containing protein [Novispirillum itersonii]